MRTLQVVGILIGLSLGSYGIYKYRSRRYGKLDYPMLFCLGCSFTS